MSTDTFDLSELTLNDQRKLINGIVVPRPIAFVSTVGSAGPNVAPFSFFNAVAVDPCMVMFSIGMPQSSRQGGEKDTILNLREVPEFVVHLVDEPVAQAMSDASAEHHRGFNEIEEHGLTSTPSLKVRPPRILECPIQMECRVHSIQILGKAPYHMVIGEVLLIHSRIGYVNDRFHVDPGLHRPIARLGGAGLYLKPTDHLAIPAPKEPPARQPSKLAE
ncbi:flavin reductase family protein [Rhizobium sp. Root1204]|uniref:flavin reductase family protein n=1 Tax=Rhizobium sp. Root1204 TaxID=1736428 RepID=UPI000A496706|nr:flavin reductase family protein [Rhizobium sp. Root1204]